MFPNGKYKIYRGSSENNQPPNYYGLVATINAYNGGNPVTTWVDPDILGGFGNAKMFYKIVAVDNSNLHSVHSDWDWVYWDRNFYKSNGNSQLVNEFRLHQNYPNPFNPITTIKYDLKQSCFVDLSVYDILGNKIATLVNEYKEAGSYNLSFDATDLASGVYFYKIISEDFTSVKKLILSK